MWNFDPLPKSWFGVWGLGFRVRLCSPLALCGLRVVSTDPNTSRSESQVFYQSFFTLQGSVRVTEQQREGRKTLPKKQDTFIHCINPAAKGGFLVPEILEFLISVQNFCPRLDSQVCKRLKSSLRGEIGEADH